jgi:hypothetical protein
MGRMRLEDSEKEEMARGETTTCAPVRGKKKGASAKTPLGYDKHCKLCQGKLRARIWGERLRDYDAIATRVV